MAKVKLKKEFIIEKHMQATQICKDCAKEARDKISEFYQEEIDKFYREYNPEYYIRHHERGYSPRGMEKTFEEALENTSSGDTVPFKGGINVNTDSMYTDYSGTPEQVLFSFLNGYHGLPPLPTPRNLNTQFSIAPITREQYGVGVHPLKDTREYIDKKLEPEFRKKHNFK